MSVIEDYINQSELANLYKDLMELACDTMELPIKIYDKMIGFGKIKKFFMFWLKFNSGEIIFTTRLQYTKNRGEDNTKSFIFSYDNKKQILSSIDAIYSSYLASLLSQSGMDSIHKPSVKDLPDKVMSITALPRKTEFVILTLSYKNGGYCVAGIDRETNKWIRLVSGDDITHNEISDKYLIGLCALDVIEVELLKRLPCLCQTENYLIDERVLPFKKGKISLCGIAEFISYGTNIFGNTKAYLSESEISKTPISLAAFIVQDIQFDFKFNDIKGKYSYKCSFTYCNQYYSDISLTDPEYRHLSYNAKTLPHAVVIISLPCIPYKGKYYKFVAKIFETDSAMPFLNNTLSDSLFVTTEMIKTPASRKVQCIRVLDKLRFGVNPITECRLFEYDENIDSLINNVIEYIQQTPKRGEAHEKATHAGAAWTSAEEARLTDEYKSGKSIREIASIHGRSNGGISSRLKKLGLIE